MTKEYTITIAELKALLELFNDDAELVFGGNGKDHYIGVTTEFDNQTYYEELKKF